VAGHAATRLRGVSVHNINRRSLGPDRPAGNACGPETGHAVSGDNDDARCVRQLDSRVFDGDRQNGSALARLGGTRVARLLTNAPKRTLPKDRSSPAHETRR